MRPNSLYKYKKSLYSDLRGDSHEVIMYRQETVVTGCGESLFAALQEAEQWSGFFPFFLSFELTVALYGNKLSAKE